MNGKQLQSQYKEHLSDFNNWKQKKHAENFILYPKNIDYHLCINETVLSKDELNTLWIIHGYKICVLLRTATRKDIFRLYRQRCNSCQTRTVV